MDENNSDGSKVEGSNQTEQHTKVLKSESIVPGKGRTFGGADSHGPPKEEKIEKHESISQSKEKKVEKPESISQSKETKVEKTDSISQSKAKKVGKAASISQPKDGKIGKSEKSRKAKHPPKSKNSTKPKTSGVARLRGTFKNFGITVKKLWDVWGRFKSKNITDQSLAVTEKTSGVPGFEEIACIEAEVPDIMMMDKDRVRTSCKECMQNLPTFPTKEQIKAKLIAADKYYGVKSQKMKKEQSEGTLDHEADYYDADGTVVRPSWRFILERPLVEQYVLMTNYIRKVSVLSELTENNPSKKGIEEEDSGSDTEYKKFEQKFIKEKQELLKPFKKPKTQNMAVQTSFKLEQDIMENLKESVSEASLYPESEESTKSPEASAVTIVTSRDYSSPLQSDFDAKTTEKSTSYKDSATDRNASNKEGKWWESQDTCQPSESFQTSYDSINKNTSSSTDGQSIPIHFTGGNTSFQHAGGEFSNESNSQIVPHFRTIQPATHRKPNDKKVSFSTVVTYYQGPNKNTALGKVPEDQDIKTETERIEQIQQDLESILSTNQSTVKPEEKQIKANPPETQIVVSPSRNQENEENLINKQDLQNNGVATGFPKRTNKKVNLGNILQETKKDQIVSVSLPANCHENRILRNKQIMNVVVSRPPGVNQPPKKIYFQEFEEIPDVDYSDPYVSIVEERTDAAIQTKIPTVNMNEHTNKFTHIKLVESPPRKGPVDGQTSQNPGHPEILPARNNPPKAQMLCISSHEESHKIEKTIPKKDIEYPPPKESTNQTSPPPAQLRTQYTADNPPIAQKLRSSSPLTSRKLDTEILNDGSSCLGTIAHEGKESISTETKIRSAPLHMIRARPRSESPKKAEHNFDDLRMGPMKSKTFSDTMPVTLPEELPAHHISRNPNNRPDIGNKTCSQQQPSTDTEGSSTSNEHLKLKASPACFFKVATPTDLSRISVDEFYPDVPEIDAELSQTRETRSSAPPVEIVFSNQEAALKYTQPAEFLKIIRKEENTILQRHLHAKEGLNCHASNEKVVIKASPGVKIKVDEGSSEMWENEGKNKYYSPATSKAAIEIPSLQSRAIKNLPCKTNEITKPSLNELKEVTAIIPQQTQTSLCRTDIGTSDPRHETFQTVKVNEMAILKEAKTTVTVEPENPNETSTQPLSKFLQNKNLISSNQQQKSSTNESIESRSNDFTLPEKSSSGSCPKKIDETQSDRRSVNKKPESYKGQGEKLYEGVNEKHNRIEKPEQSTNNNENLVTIQRQTESLPLDPENQLVLHGRAKLYMRTLSSLAEETSSVAEGTSSTTQEKLIDMPVIARSVEELKTIFEQKPSMSGESETQVEESHSDSRKCTRLSPEKDKTDEADRKLFSAELDAPADRTIKNPIATHPIIYEADKKSNSQSQESSYLQSKQNQPTSAAVKLQVTKASDMNQSKTDTVEDDKPEQSKSSSCGDEGARNPPALLQENPSAPQLSQIDIIRASEIYSNTSMYFSTSEDRVAKLNKARTSFQPMLLDDELEGSANSRGSAKSVNETDTPKTTIPGPSKNLVSSEKVLEMPKNVTGNNEDAKLQVQFLKLKTNQEGDNFLIGINNHQTIPDTREALGKGIGESEEPPTTEQGPSHGSIRKTKSKMSDTSNSSETKQWLMDVIPVLPKHARTHGFRLHKPVCVKEVTEAEAVKFRQEAVKPVFRFLKKQREMEENEE